MIRIRPSAGIAAAADQQDDSEERAVADWPVQNAGQRQRSALFDVRDDHLLCGNRNGHAGTRTLANMAQVYSRPRASARAGPR